MAKTFIFLEKFTPLNNSVLHLLNSNHKKLRKRVKDQKLCLHHERFQTFSCKFDYVHCL